MLDQEKTNVGLVCDVRLQSVRRYSRGILDLSGEIFSFRPARISMTTVSVRSSALLSSFTTLHCLSRFLIPTSSTLTGHFASINVRVGATKCRAIVVYKLCIIIYNY